MSGPRNVILAALAGLALVSSHEVIGQASKFDLTAVGSLLWDEPETSAFIRQTLRAARIGDTTGIEFTDFNHNGTAGIRVSHTWRRAWGTLHQGVFPADSGWFYSPDSSKALWLLRYLGEPDVALDLYNRHGDSLVEQLESCGTPCRYLAVRWLDNNRFVFVMVHELFEGRGERPSVTAYEARVSLYDLESDSVYVFKSAPTLRRPSYFIDTVISLIWDNPVAVYFIHTTFEEAAIPGYRDGSLSYFEVTDSSSIDLRIEPNSTLARPENGLWMLSPDSSRAATVVPLPGDSTQLRIHESRGDSTVRRMYSSDATRRHLAVRWLSDDLLLVLRVDEDGHFSQRLGHRVVDGNVATAILYNFERGYQLSFGSYILMPD